MFSTSSGSVKRIIVLKDNRCEKHQKTAIKPTGCQVFVLMYHSIANPPNFFTYVLNKVTQFLQHVFG